MRRVVLASIFLLAGCCKTEIVNQSIPTEDSLAVKPRKELTSPPQKDTAEVDDTARYSIGFEPTVEDWDESSVEM